MTRVAVCGRADLDAAAATLGLEAVEERPDLVIVDLEDPPSVRRAAFHAADVPRVLIAQDGAAELLRAIGSGVQAVRSCDPAVLGPAVVEVLPAHPRGRTRSVVVTSPTGGVGRTLLVANVAARLASTMTVLVLDATGTGAAGWWLGATPSPWSDLEGLVEELGPEHLAIVASEVHPRLRVVGGGPLAPTRALVVAAARAGAQLADLVLIDAPLLADPTAIALAELADRLVVLCADHPHALAILEASLDRDAWILASDPASSRIAGRDVLRSIPRDAGSVEAAERDRAPVRGGLGRAYDEVAELIAIDAGR